MGSAGVRRHLQTDQLLREIHVNFPYSVLHWAVYALKPSGIKKRDAALLAVQDTYNIFKHSSSIRLPIIEVNMAVHRDKLLIIEPTRCTNFSFFLFWN